MAQENKMELRSYPVKIPKSYLGFMISVFLVHAVIGCQDSPVGIADSSIIPDDRFTASSYYGSAYEPWDARLKGAGRGWGPGTRNSPSDYLQIDLGQLFVICAVATQGANGMAEWTTQYKISTSFDNSVWTNYTTGGRDQLFLGNTNRDTVVKNILDVPVVIRYIRFIPTSFYNYKVLRVEVYGIRRGCSSHPVGISSGKIPDSDMTSSSAYNSTTSPSKARLNYRAGSSWCAATRDSSPYLQINLGSPYIICGISTQGDHMTDHWIQSYHMLTSSDGAKFTNYMENSELKSFGGNFDSSTAVKNALFYSIVSQYIRVVPTSHYGSTYCMRTELYGMKPDGVWTSMVVGLFSSKIIPDHRFTASSSYGGSYEPWYARLKASGKAWTPKTSAGGDWLQIDLGSVVFMCAVATQGAGFNNEYAKSYKMRWSLDNIHWKYYQENNVDKTFTGNINDNGVVKNSLNYTIKAKFVRFYPITLNYWPSMRVEVYGIYSGCSFPVGLESPSVIQDSQMTSSSNLDNNHIASKGRLYGTNSWCSHTLSNTEYIQINLGQVMTVTGIATQGDDTMDKWVTKYTIRYSMNGNLWNTYKDGGNSDKILLGNNDRVNITVRWLSLPLTARHVRVMPQTWNTAICMRIELYGCDYGTRPVISGLTNQINLTAASNSYVDLVCIVQEPLIQYIKWYTGNTDITSRSTGLVRGANGVKQSTLRVNYTSGDDIINNYDCDGPVCRKAFVCIVMHNITNTGLKSADVYVKLDHPTTLATPTVHDIKSTSVTVRWTQPPLKASQARVLSHVLQYQNSSHTQTINVSAPATSHVISGLAIYTNYSVRIKAISRVGTGLWSVTRIFTTDSASPVGTPSSIAATALSSQSIRITWQAPTSGIDGSLLGYKVSCISRNDRRENVTTPQQTSHTFTGLKKWTVYTCAVAIRNDKGDGPNSSYVTRRTLEDAPGKPQIFQVTVRDSTRVLLDWALPNERNGIIRGFKLNYGRVGSWKEKDLPDNTTLSHMLTGLEECTQYSFKILAYTIKDGPFTSVIQKTTAEHAPGTPNNIVVLSTEKRAITLGWQKPTSTTVESYRIIYEGKKDYNSSFVHNGSLSTSSTTKEVTNLYPDTRYTFQVSATTGCGKGDYSQPLSSTTKIDAPPAPGVGSVGSITAEVNDIKVWQSPDINGQIMVYQIIVVRVDRTCSFDKTKLKSYEEAEKEKLHYYIAAEIKADGGKKSPRFFKLGDGEDYGGYKNVKLEDENVYRVLQRALTQDEQKEYLAGPIKLIAEGKTSKESSPAQREQTKVKTCTVLDSPGFAASIACNGILLAVLALLVVYIINHKKKHQCMRRTKKRPRASSLQDNFENIIENPTERGLPMRPLPIADTPHEDMNSETRNPSNVQAATRQATEPTSTVISSYGLLGEARRPEPNPEPEPEEQLYEIVPEQNTTALPSLTMYQQPKPGNQTKPVEEAVKPTANTPNSKHLQENTATYQPLNEEKRTKPNYQGLNPESKAPNPKEIKNTLASSSESRYQALKPEKRVKPDYQGLQPQS